MGSEGDQTDRSDWEIRQERHQTGRSDGERDQTERLDGEERDKTKKSDWEIEI